MTLLVWLTFLLGILTVTLIILPYWIFLFLLALVFVLEWFFLHWEIAIMKFLLIFYQIKNGMSRFIV